MSSVFPLDYSNTPSPLPPPPRHVVTRAGRFRIWYDRILFVVFVALWLWATIYLALIILTQLNGTNVDGAVTDASASFSRRSTNYRVDFTYTVNGVQYEDSARVSKATYEHALSIVHVPDPQRKRVTIRHFALGPLHHAIFMDDLSENTDLPFAVIVNVALAAAFYVFFVLGFRRRMLVKHGEAVNGTIYRKHFRKTRRRQTYYLYYRFEHPVTGRTFESYCDALTETQYEAATVGEAVTVLFEPRKPQRSILYECDRYAVRLADGTLLVAQNRL